MGLTRHRIVVATPFRLDLTAALLCRFPARMAETEWSDAAYVRALPGAAGPIVVAITQPVPDAIEITIDDPRADDRSVCASVCRMLGVDANLTAFERAAATIPWLCDLAKRMRGVKPARYPSLWEAGVNAIVFQSVSMFAAGAVIDRLTAAFATCARHHDRDVMVFPTVEAIAGADDTALRATGLSRAKIVAVRALADAVAAGDWDERPLESLPTSTVCTLLSAVRGIGSWSAAVIALRGLGRLDAFPMRDSGVVRTIDQLSGGRANGVAEALAALGENRGMLYHLLLLARLDAREKLAL